MGWIASLIIGLVCVFVSYNVGLSVIKDWEYKKSQDQMIDNIVTIVGKGIYNSDAYMSDKGGYCSSSIDARDISAYRVSKCAGLSAYEVKLKPSGVETNGEDSYFTFMKEWSLHPEACRFYIKNEDDFLITTFLTCKGLDDNFRLENKVVTTIKNKLSLYYKSHYKKAKALTGEDTEGTDRDGMIKITFLK